MLLLSCVALAATLEEAWHAAESNSVDLAMLHERTVQAETMRGAAWALVQPKVQLGGTYTINEYAVELDLADMIPEEYQGLFEGGEPITVLEKEYLAANASIIQPLLFSEAIPQLKGAHAMVKAARAEEDAARARVRAGIARAYWGVVVTREGVSLAEQALQSAKKHEELARVQVTAGTEAPTLGLQAEIGVARAERERMSARERAVVAEEAFAKLTGLPRDTLVTMPELTALPFSDLDSAVQHAMNNQPAIAAADLHARAARYDRLAKDLSWLPTVDGRFTYSYTENTGFNDDPTMWMVVFEGKWTVWDGGFRIATEKKAASVRRLADLAGETARLDAHEEVRVLWERHARAESALVAVERELALSEKNLELAQVAFTAGTITFLQLEDARLGRDAAQLARLSQHMDRDLSVIDLLAATGALPQ